MDIQFRSLNEAVAAKPCATTALKIAVLMASYNLHRFVGDPAEDTGTFQIDQMTYVWKMEVFELREGNRVTRMFQVTLAETPE